MSLSMVFVVMYVQLEQTFYLLLEDFTEIKINLVG